MNIYKCNFKNMETWLGEKSSNLVDEEGVLLSGIEVALERHLTYPAAYDEDGNEVTPAGEYDTYAVDILTELDLPDLYKYCVVPRDSWHHNFSGRYTTIVWVIPDDSWLKDDIRTWLTANSIDWEISNTKVELLDLI